MKERNHVIVRIDHLQHNFNLIKDKVKQAKILVMIKANAYGCGAHLIAAGLPDADAFGVATIDEAIALRQLGIEKTIVVMSGVYDSETLALAVNYQLTVVIFEPIQLQLLLSHQLSGRIAIWLKVNTGMNRLGFAPADFSRVIDQCEQCSWVDIDCLMTHLASADSSNTQQTDQQLTLFKQLTAQYDYPRSVANSAAILNHHAELFDWVRPGGLVLGLSPGPGVDVESQGFIPVMTLQARIIAIQILAPNDAVGYGATWCADRKTKLGVVALGYGDGYPRDMPADTPTVVNGVVCPIVGRVSMDLLTIDLSNAHDAVVGDSVTLWGGSVSVNAIAESLSRHAYELTSQLSLRVRRLSQQQVLLSEEC